LARLVFLGSIIYLMIGIGQLVLGTVMEPMVQDYRVGYSDGGQLVMYQFLGGMAGVLAVPWLIRTLGLKRLILAAMGLVAVAETGFFLQPAWSILSVLAPLAGVGLGITEAAVASFIISAAAQHANKAMSRTEVFFGLGALLIPFAGSLLISAGRWELSFLVVAIAAVIAIAAWLLLWQKTWDAQATPPSVDEIRRRKSRMGGPARLTLAVCFAFFFLYVGIEMSFVHFLPSMMVQNNGIEESTAALSISLFWLAMAIGRVIAGPLADRFGGSTYLLAMCASNAVILLLMVRLDSVFATFTLAFLAGLAMSGIFSIALVFATRAIPDMTENTTSVLLAAGGAGGALLSKMVGWFLDRFQEDMTRWLFAALGIVLLLVMIAAARAASRSKPTQKPVQMVTE